MIRGTLLLHAALILLLASSANGQGFTLVEDGQGRCSITLAAKGCVADFAAEELRRYVQEMTGADLPVVAAGGKVSLAVDSSIGWDAYRITAGEQGLELAGGNPRGLLYAVYHVLEGLGCRFLAIGPEGENVPKAKTLVIGAGTRTFQPALRYRGLIVQQPLCERNLLMADWMAKNRMNYWVNPCWVFPWASKDLQRRFVEALENRGILWEFGHHTFEYWITQGRKEPELLGLKAGKRTSKAICIANPRSGEKIAENIAAFVLQWPQVDVVSLWANDSTDGWCECDPCKALTGNVPRWRNRAPLMTRPYFAFVAKVAAAAKARGVTQPLCTLAYMNTLEPTDDTQFAPDVLVTVAPIFRDYTRPIAAQEYFGPVMNRWAARLGEKSEPGRNGARVMAYEYYAGVYANNSLPWPTVALLADDIGHYIKTGFGGITSQAEQGHWGTYGLNFYALARMTYHGVQDPKRLIADFCADYYGPAAEPMTHYWTWQETLMRQQQSVAPAGGFFRVLCTTPGAIDKLDGWVADAERLAGEGHIKARVRLSRFSVDYMRHLKEAAEAGRGTAMDTLKPTPKGKSHLGPLQSGRVVHLRFPVAKAGGLELRLGNVVAMNGVGTSYQMQVRRDAPDGQIIHAGKTFTCTAEQAETRTASRAWNDDNRAPISITAALTEADRARGYIDVFVTAHVQADAWTIYRDDNDSTTWDMYAHVPPPDAEQARREAWGRLEQFVKANARAGIFNAAPDFVLSECRKLINVPGN